MRNLFVLTALTFVLVSCASGRKPASYEFQGVESCKKTGETTFKHFVCK